MRALHLSSRSLVGVSTTEKGFEVAFSPLYRRVGDVMINPLMKKIDARGRYQLKRNQLSGKLEVMVLTTRRPTFEQRQELQAAGCSTRFELGNVLTCSISDVAHLEVVARLPFVRKIELSRSMFED